MIKKLDETVRDKGGKKKKGKKGAGMQGAVEATEEIRTWVS